MRRYAAHLHTASAGYLSCGKVEVKQLRRLFCVLAVNLKEIAHLKQHDVVRVGFLDGVIAVVGGVSHHILCLRLIIKRLFVWCKIAVHPNQLRDTRSDLVPIHLNICTARFFQRDALAAVILVAAALSGYGMGMPADAVLLFQKIGILLGSVRSLEKRIDAGLSTLKAAPVCKRSRNFIFGDKPAGCWNSLHIGAEFLSWKGQIFQTCEKCLRPVVMEAQQRTVFAVGVHEYLVF